MPDVAAALAKDGVLDGQALTRALGAARDGDVASTALRLGLAPEGALVRTLARAHGYPGVDLSRSVVPAANRAAAGRGIRRAPGRGAARRRASGRAGASTLQVERDWSERARVAFPPCAQP